MLWGKYALQIVSHGNLSIDEISEINNNHVGFRKLDVKWKGMCHQSHQQLSGSLRKKYPNREFFLVRKSPCSVRKQKNTDQKILIWTLFKQWVLQIFEHFNIDSFLEKFNVITRNLNKFLTREKSFILDFWLEIEYTSLQGNWYSEVCIQRYLKKSFLKF